jgi:hypothetical protein
MDKIIEKVEHVHQFECDCSGHYYRGRDFYCAYYSDGSKRYLEDGEYEVLEDSSWMGQDPAVIKVNGQEVVCDSIWHEG